MKDFVAPRFTVNPGLPPALQAAARDMSAAHVQRVRGLLGTWLRKAPPGSSLNAAVMRALARLAHEFAAWSIDSTGPAYDDLQLQALREGGVCRLPSEDASELDRRLFRLRNLPPDAQAESLRHEAELLARWGQPRSLPEVGQPFDLDSAVAQLRVGTRTQPPLAPVVAYWFLATDPSVRRAPEATLGSLRCGLAQWALQAALQSPGLDPAAQRAALQRWRDTLQIDAADVVWRERAAVRAAPPDQLPEFATRFGVQGEVELRLAIDAQGKLRRATVAQRKVTVDGLPTGVRPVGFETLLDGVSLAKARTLALPVPPADRLRNGEMVVSQSFAWRLE